MERNFWWFHSEYRLTLYYLLVFLVEWAVCEFDLFVLKSLSCFVLHLMGMFVVLLSLLLDTFSVILSWVSNFSLKVVFSFLNFFYFLFKQFYFVFLKVIFIRVLFKVLDLDWLDNVIYMFKLDIIFINCIGNLSFDKIIASK